MNTLRLLFAAPHRLPFLTGCIGLGSSAAWWLFFVVGWQSGQPLLAETSAPPALLHAPILLFTGYAPFVFGFLMTVFPRWMGYPDLTRAQFGPVAALIALGVVAAQLGLWCGAQHLLAFGFGLAAAGWLLVLPILGKLIARNRSDGKPPCWHAISALTALTIGLAALILAIGFLVSGSTSAWRWSHTLAAGGFLLPVFLTVAHRMIPFFAGSVVAGYQRWRPDWLLAALWALLLLRLCGLLADLEAMVVVANIGLAMLTALMTWKWWPRAEAPGLLKVLIWGFAWAPIGFALAALDGLGLNSGLAPVHALMIGFCGSLLVAMVTRVTHGHSGRPLAMHPLAWFAFAAVQLAAAIRIGAALSHESVTLLVFAALVFGAGLMPWLIRNAAIYLAPRRDGKPG